jgi:hypothetical protein
VRHEQGEREREDTHFLPTKQVCTQPKRNDSGGDVVEGGGAGWSTGGTRVDAVTNPCIETGRALVT